MDLVEIQQTIPNRPPYLWVDAVVSLSDDRIRTRKLLSADLAVFAVHYPDFPVFPAALQCECVFQASAILIASLGVSTAGKVPVVARANNLKFRRMVRPGDLLVCDVSLEHRHRDVFFLKGHVLRDGDTVASLDFVTTATKRPAPAKSVTEASNVN